MDGLFQRKWRINKVWFDKEKIFVLLSDGKEVGCPLSWFPLLQNATQKELMDYELICDGTGVHWESLDEDLSAEGFITYSPQKAVTV